MAADGQDLFDLRHYIAWGLVPVPFSVNVGMGFDLGPAGSGDCPQNPFGKIAVTRQSPPKNNWWTSGWA
jgi:hypothetical protein